MAGLLFLACREPIRLNRPFVRFDFDKPAPAEQRRVWEIALGAAAFGLNGTIDSLAEQFRLSTKTIFNTSALVTANDGFRPGELWSTCRSLARPKLEDLAERIVPSAAWDDLVLPEPQKQILRQIAGHVRYRLKVYETWGFAAKGRRGLGVSALFAGQSGTGKTMAAEVLAGDLGLDLYRIDLSAVVSKYIGETEKNLKQVFDAAEEGGVLLLFDEADALFGKRSEVKDSHDRYANIEVAYLLQRMETYQGLAILTTNLKSSLDQAFQRRLRFTVTFPFPDAALREAIWQRIFPKETPRIGLDYTRLAQLNVAGGNIRNIALNAAFIAAEAGKRVRMDHVLEATRLEAQKIERPLAESETRGWL
jgi:SpoVK/Ycf46/Vps4 family AAA+-type ATPase